MKKLIILITIIFLGTIAGYSQDCPPDKVLFAAQKQIGSPRIPRLADDLVRTDAFPFRDCESAERTPLPASTFDDHSVWHFVNIAPFGQGSRYSRYFHHYRISLVAPLFKVIGPSYISRLIVPVYVDSIQTVPGRGLATKGRQELAEVGKSKLNASPAIPRIGSIIRICAAGFCGLETPQLRTRLFVDAFSVGDRGGLGTGNGDTPARDCVAGTQITRGSNTATATIAITFPSQLSAGGTTGKTDNSKLSKFLAD